ncbi:MAG TPA: immunoglobulin-like domain-containing protein [Candidatus Paceibacterota bacterium]|nr:immunoglobulin-like domain-containing protein [Candidatus Paceibacterota bacterium]
MLSARAAAKRLSCAPDYIGKLCREGKLHGTQVQGAWFVEEVSVHEFEIARAEAKAKRSASLARERRAESAQYAHVRETAQARAARSERAETEPVRATAPISSPLLSSSVRQGILLAVGGVFLFGAIAFAGGIHGRDAALAQQQDLSASVAQVDSPFFGARPLAVDTTSLPNPHTSLISDVVAFLSSLFGGAHYAQVQSPFFNVAPSTSTTSAAPASGASQQPVVAENNPQPSDLPSSPAAATTTIVQNTYPVIERTVEHLVSGVTEDELTQKLNQLDSELTSKIFSSVNSNPAPVYSSGGPTNNIALSQIINNLNGVTITGATITGSSIDGYLALSGGTLTGPLNNTSAGTSTFAGSIELTGGCFSINGTCIGQGSGFGSVTSVDASGGSTGLAFTGGPITGAGTLTLGGVLAAANGGTGTSTAPGYGMILVGNSSGGYDLVATSSLGLVASGGTGFSTTSADYWKSANNFFATSSADYWKTQNNFFSTSSASYFLAQNQGSAFSTTSASYFLSQQNVSGFSTTSADYWKSINNFFSTTSSNYAVGAYVSASSTIPHVGGGTFGDVLVWNGTTWTASATSTLGLGGSGGGSVTSVDASGGSTGLAFTGGPITGAGTLTLSGTLGAGNGGTGSTTLGGILVGNGTGAIKSLVVGSGLAFDGTTLTATGIGGSAFPFIPTSAFGTAANATSTLIGFNAGLYALASSTIGNGTQGGGLTINGGATTTGTLAVLGTGTSTFAGNIGIAGSIIPAITNTYSLGAPGSTFKDIYLGPGSLYVNGQEVIHTDVSNNVVVSSDVNQNLVLQTSGSANIELNPSGTGQVLIKNNVNITGGKSITTSDLSALSIPNGVAAGNLTIAGHTIQATDTNGGIFLTPNGSGGTYVTAGNVGIGTTSPSNKFEVNGSEYIGGNSHITGTLTLGALNGLLAANNGVISTVSTSTFGFLSSSSLSALAPLSYDSSTGQFSIQAASGSQGGYLSQTDWNAFNAKLGSSSLSGSYPVVYNPSTATYSLAFGTTTANSWSQLQQFNAASTSKLSVYQSASFGGSATSTFSSTGALSLAGGLTLGTITGTTQCLHVNAAGVVSGTGSDCGSGGGGGGATNFLDLTDTPNTYTAGQVFFTNQAETAVVGDNSFTFDGTTLNAPAAVFTTLTNLGSANLGTVSTGVWHGTAIADSYVADNLTISGGTINNTPIGAATPSTAVFTNATSTNATTTNFYASGQTRLGSLTGLVSANGGIVTAVATNTLGLLGSTSLSATAPLAYNSSTGVFSISQASGSQDGYLASVDWTQFNNKVSSTSLSATGPLAYNPATGVFSLDQAGTSQDGYLSSADWNVFNNKISSSSLSAAGPLSYNSSTGQFTISQASGSQNGYLSSGDWTIFNNKVSSSSLALVINQAYPFPQAGNGTSTLTQFNGGITAYASSTISALTSIFATTSSFAILNVPSALLTTNAQGQVVATSTLGVAYGGTGSSTLGGILIGNGRGSVTSANVSAPLSFSGNTLSIQAASGSQNGYLSSADWTTFNNKISSTSLSAAAPLSYNSSTGQFTISQASGSQNGYLSSSDWNSFNARLSTTTLGLFDKGYFFSTTSADYYLSQQSLVGFSTTSANYWKTQNNFFSTTSAIYFANASTTIPKTYTANTFTGAQTFQNGITTNALSVGSLTGPLQAIGGVVSSTSTLSIIYGGTGTSTPPTYGKVLLGNAQGGYDLVGTSSLGLITNNSLSAIVPLQYNTGTGVFSIQNAKADSSTLGAATFASNDFNDNGSGLISIDYANAQKATGSQAGLLASSDWNVFNNKISSSSLSGASVIAYNGTTGVISTQAGTFGGNASSVYTFPGDLVTTGTATTTNLYIGGTISGANLSSCSGASDKLLWNSSTQQFSCGTDAGASGSDVNWTHFNNSGIRVTTATDQVLIGFTSTSSLSKLEVHGGATIDNATTTNLVTTGVAYFSGNVGIGTTSPYQSLTVASGNILQVAGSNPTLATSTAVGGSTYGVYTSGNYAYVAAGSVRIVDTTQPGASKVVGSYTGTTQAQSIVVSGKYAYVGDASAGLAILDVSNPASPTLVGSLNYSTVGHPLSIALSGRYLIVPDFDSGKVSVVDIANPAAPAVVGTYTTGGAPATVALSGKYAYIGDQADGNIYIEDISNPAKPVALSPYTGLLGPQAIYISGRYAYVADIAGGLYALDISNPASVSLAGSKTGTGYYTVEVAGDYAYVTDSSGNLVVLDVHNLGSITTAGTYATGVSPRGLALSGKYAYVTSGNSTLKVVDINGAKLPAASIGTIETNSINVADAVKVGGDGFFGGGLNVGASGIFSRGGLAVLGSTTLTDLIAKNATTTNATSTNLYASSLIAGNATSTNLSVSGVASTSNLYISNLVAGALAITASGKAYSFSTSTWTFASSTLLGDSNTFSGGNKFTGNTTLANATSTNFALTNITNALLSTNANGSIIPTTISSPLTFSGNTLSIQQATASQNGYLSLTDWNTFNDKISSTSLSGASVISYDSSSGVITTQPGTFGGSGTYAFPNDVQANGNITAEVDGGASSGPNINLVNSGGFGVGGINFFTYAGQTVPSAQWEAEDVGNWTADQIFSTSVGGGTDAPLAARLIIKGTTGYVGIGTTSPLTTLSVGGNTYLGGSLTATGTVQFSNLAAGAVAATANGQLYTFSTSTWTFASSTLLGDSNTFSGNDTFTTAPKLGSLTGLVAGNSGNLYGLSTSSLNASITGQAGNVANSVTFNNGGSGASSGSTFNGSSAVTISYNTIGAVPATRNINTTFPLQGGGSLASDLTITSAFGTTTTTGLTPNQILYTNANGVLTTAASSTLNLPNAALQNSSVTVNGITCTLGSTCTVASTTLLANSNIFSGNNTFTGNTTLANATSTNLALTNITNALLSTNGSGSIIPTTVSSPLTFSGNTLSIQQANGSQNGYLSSTDWTQFNNKVSSSSLATIINSAYEFPGNATSTQLTFNGGLVATGATTTNLAVTGTASTSNLFISNLAAGALGINASGKAYSFSTSTWTFASSTLLSDSNTFSGNNKFTNPITLGTLNGPLQANNGVVSATSSVGVLYGGTGLTSAPSYGNILVGNSSGGYTLTATSSLGLASLSSFSATAPLSYDSSTGVFSISQANGSQNGYLSSVDWTAFNNKISSTSLSGGTGINYTSSTGVITNTGVIAVGPAGQTQNGTVTIASTTASFNGLTFGVQTVGAAGTLTNTPTIAGTLDNSGLTHSTIGLADANSTLTVSGSPAALGASLSATLNLAHGNIWTAASTTFVGGVTIGSATTTNLVATNATTTNLAITSLANTLLSVNAQGAVVATSSLSVNYLAGVLPVGNGGTGSSTLGGILTGNGTGQVTSAQVSSPLTFSGNTLSIQAASGSQNGYLSSTDWTTFNNKISSTSLSASAPLSYNSSTGQFSISQANGSTNGYLTSSDWTQFNAKVSSSSLALVINQAYEFPNNATSTQIAFNGGLTAAGATTTNLSVSGTASTSNLFISNLAAGALGINATGKAYSFSTSTWTFASSTLLGDNNTFSGTDTFTNAPKLSTLTGLISGNSGTLYGTATGTVSGSNGISVTAGQSIIGSGLTITATNAVADASTKGVATFAANDFNDNGSGLISIDYANGQLASGSQNGFLSNSDWNSFNSRLSTTTLGLFDKGYFFSTTSASYFLAQNQGNAFSTTSAIYFANASTTIPKTYTANTFTGAQTFQNGITTNALSLGTLSGPLQANNGVVSATSSIGVLYGGTGLTSAPSYGTILVGNSSGGYTLTATSSLGLAALSSFSATAPLQYDNTTGIFSITQANGSTNGYLSSVDWTAFNNKISSTSLSATGPLSYNPSTGVFAISQANGSTNGYLSSTDWNTFNQKVSSSSLYSYVAGNKDWQIINGALSPTTTLGIGVYASSTIGNGAQSGGLTVNGGATTTGNAYFAGNVGIGTQSPSARLDINASYTTTGFPLSVKNSGYYNAYFQGTNANNQASFYMENDRGSFASYGGFLYGGSTSGLSNLFGAPRADRLFMFADGASNLGYYVGTLTAQPFVIGTNNLERARVDGTTGYVGIATTSPLTTLSVGGNTYLGGNLTATGTVQFTNLSAGAVAATANGTLYTFSTSTWTFASSTLLGDNNTFSGNNTFTNVPKLGGLTGLVAGNSGNLYGLSTTSLNASITGQAGNVANAVTFNNSGSGASSGSTFNGSSAVTISYNTIGAQVAGTYVTSVGATYPLISSGGTAPVISSAFGTSTNWGLGANGIVVTNASGVPFIAASSTLNLPNSALQNSTITVNGIAFNLGDSKTITAASSTLLANSNTFSGNNTFTGNTTLANATSTNLALTNITNALLSTNGSGSIIPTTVSSPLTFSGNTLSIQAASASQNGYLSSTDWTQFNNKVSSSSLAAVVNQAYEFPSNATSTQIAFNGGLTATGATTTNLSVTGTASTSQLYISNLSTGGLGISSTGKVYSFATSTWTFASSTLLGDSNTFSGNNTFTNAPKLGSLTGLVAGNSGNLYGLSTSSLNASITGQAGNVANSVTFNNGGSGASSGSTFNGSGALTVSYNTIGAQVAGTYVTSVNATYPLLSSGGTAPTISTAFGTTTNTGIGSNLFIYTDNNGVFKGAASSSLNLPNSALQNSSITINTSGGLTGGAAVSLGNSISLGCQAASGSQAGCLSSTDWTTFNNKVSSSSLAALNYAAYPFYAAGNATTTLTQFNGGLTAYASSTIGNGILGLTVNGPATTTGNLVVQGSGTSTIAGSLSVSGNLNFNGNLLQNGVPFSSSQWITNGSSIYYGTGNVGIGTSTPYAKLSVAGDIVGGTINATSTTATSTIAGSFNVGNGALSYDVNSGITSINNLQLGAQTFDADAGILSWIDMPVTSASSAGTVESYSAQIDGNPLLTIYSQSDGSGGIQNAAVGIGTTSPFAMLSVQGSGYLAGSLTITGITATGTVQLTSLTGGAVAANPNGTLYTFATSTLTSASSTLLGDSNTFSGNNTFTNAPKLGSLTGFVAANNGTLYQLASSSLNLPNAALQNSSITINGTAFNLGDSKTVAAASSTLLGDTNTFSGTQNAFTNKVGIGTTSPRTTLQVAAGGSGILPQASSIAAFESNSNGYISLLTPDSAENGLLFGSPTGGNADAGIIYNNNTNLRGLTFRTGGNNTHMVIDSSGNVGIGTTSPGATFAVAGDGYLTGALTVGGQTTLAASLNGLLKATNGVVSAAVAGTDYSNFAYPFPLTGNATSSLTQFNGGLTAYATSTIGNGAQAGGLTVSGGATTTGNAYFGGNVGIGTNAPTSALTLALGNSIALYNTADQTTNYERGQIDWTSNALRIETVGGGSGSNSRSVILSSGGANLVTASAGTVKVTLNGGTSGVGPGVLTNGSFNGASTNQVVQSIAPTFNQSGTSGYTALLIQPTETAVGSGNKYLIQAGTSTAATLFAVDNAGNITTNITGSTQCLHVNSSGVISGTGADCGAGGSPFPFTPLALGNATSTLLLLNNGVIAAASSTIGNGTAAGGLTINGSATSTGTTTIQNAFAVTGTNGGVPVSGAGTRLEFIPNLGALRAGQVSSTQWDASNIGTSSFATGLDTTASGGYSAALGYRATASGVGSFAGGYFTDCGMGIISSGIGSFAYGYLNHGVTGCAFTQIQASGNGSVAMGYALAGRTITATQSGSIALGYANNGSITSSGIGSFAVGDGNITSSGSGSVALGYGESGLLSATGQGAVAIGANVNATQNNALAFGSSFTNNIASTFQVGFSATPTLTVTATNTGIGTTSPYAKFSISANGSDTNSTLFAIASSTSGTATSTLFAVSNIGTITTTLGAGAVGVNSLGQLYSFATSSGSAASSTLLADYNTFSHLQQFNGGFTAYASSTIGNGAQIGGLTVSGGATTTGNAYFAGNVGVGTVSPGSTLDVGGTAQLRGAGGGTGLYVNSSGNVGIGTTGQNAKLEIRQDGNGVQTQLVLRNNQGSSNGATSRLGFGVYRDVDATALGAAIDAITTAGIPNGDNAEGAILAFSTTKDGTSGLQERMRILNTGNVGIGTKNPQATLDVQGTASSSNLFVTNAATTTSLAITGLTSQSCIGTNSQGQVVAGTCGGGGSPFPFTPSALGNSTSTLLLLNNGVIATASSTIGNGTATGGLTVNGNSTTTGNVYVAGAIGIGTKSPWASLDVNGSIAIANNNGGSTNKLYLASGDGTHYIYSTGSGVGGNNTYFGEWGGNYHFLDTSNSSEPVTITGGNLGVGTTTPTAKLSLQYNSGDTQTTLFAIASSTGSTAVNLFSVDNTGLTTIGNPTGTGDANIQFGGDATAWSVGNYGGDNSFRIASSTNLANNVAFEVTKAGTASTTNLTISSLGASAGSCLTTDSSGNVTTTTCGGGGSPFPFTPSALGNSTSTLLLLNNGVIAAASSTIGNGNQNGGLTVSGGATTTGNAYFAGNVGINNTLAVGGNVVTSGAQIDSAGVIYSHGTGGISFALNSTGSNYGTIQNDAPDTWSLGTNSMLTGLGTHVLTWTKAGNIGIGTSTPASLLTVSNSNTGTLTYDGTSLTVSPVGTTTTAGAVTITPGAAGGPGLGIKGFNGNSIAQIFTSSGSLRTLQITNTGAGGLQTVFAGGTGKNLIGIGTTSPFAPLSIAANGGDTNPTLFAISSSTAAFATTTLFSVSNTGSTTIANGVNITSGCYAVNGTCLSTGGSGGSPFPFTPSALGNSTSTLLLLNNGVIASASSTIGNGTAAGGLTVNGNSTTTGSLYTGGGITIAGTNPSFVSLSENNGGVSFINYLGSGSDGTGTYITNTSNHSLFLGTNNTTKLTIAAGGNVGIGSTTPGTLLSIGSVNGINFTTATSTFNSTGGINITNGCYAVNGVCLTTGGGSSQWTTSGSSIYYNTGSVGVGTSSPFAKFSVQQNYGDTQTTLFQISSSTATGGATANSFFSVDNTGLTTIGDPSGTGDANFQFANDNHAWSVGYYAGDNSFRIASGTSLASNPAISVDKNGTTTISNGVNIQSGCFSVQGTCLSFSSGAADSQFVSTDGQANITTSTTSLATISITPSTATGDVFVSAKVSMSSKTATDFITSIAVRDTTCTGTIFAQAMASSTSASGSNGSTAFANGLENNPGTTSQTYALCASDTSGTNPATYFLSALVINPGADVAELYSTLDAGIQPGDIVSADTTHFEGVRKSSPYADSQLMGVVSTNPSVVIGTPVNQNGNIVPIALRGRIPVKVNLEGGDIAVGDRITLSSVSGVGKKAGDLDQSIGIALEPFTAQSTTTSVLVFLDMQQGDNVGALTNTLLGTSTATSTATSTPQTGFLSVLFSRIASWLGGAGNGIANIFTQTLTATVVNADTVNTKQLCITDASGGKTCVTKAQLDQLLQGQGGSAGSGAGSGSGSGGAGSGSGTTMPASPDPDAPTITINGANPAMLVVGDTYADLGVTVSDAQDQNLGYLVSLDGAATTTPDQIHIDTSAAGTHTITYVATDNDGNVTTALRTVIVQDAASSTPSVLPPVDTGDTGTTTGSGADAGGTATSTDAGAGAGTAQGGEGTTTPAE